MGRPKKNEEDKRIYRLSIRCTKEEKEIIDNLANDLNVSQADVIRTLAIEAYNLIRGQ